MLLTVGPFDWLAEGAHFPEFSFNNAEPFESIDEGRTFGLLPHNLVLFINGTLEDRREGRTFGLNTKEPSISLALKSLQELDASSGSSLSSSFTGIMQGIMNVNVDPSSSLLTTVRVPPINST
jgi:hypothetical protein